jgi:hypothetical protein
MNFILNNVIIPVPIYTNHDCGDISNNDLLALLITLNIPMVIIFFIRIYKCLKNKETIGYIFDDDFSELPILNTMLFVMLNGIALIIVVASLISNILNG